MTSINCFIYIFLLSWECRHVRCIEFKICPGMKPMKLTDSLKHSMDNSVFWTVAYTDNTDVNLYGLPIRSYTKMTPGSSCYIQYYVQNSTHFRDAMITRKYEHEIEKGIAVFTSKQGYKEWVVYRIQDQIRYMMVAPRITNGSKNPFGLIHVGANGDVHIYQSCDLKIIYMKISDSAVKNHTIGQALDKKHTDEMIDVVRQYGYDPDKIHYIQPYFTFNPNYRYFANRKELKLYAPGRRNAVLPITFYDPIEIMNE